MSARRNLRSLAARPGALLSAPREAAELRAELKEERHRFKEEWHRFKTELKTLKDERDALRAEREQVRSEHEDLKRERAAARQPDQQVIDAFHRLWYMGDAAEDAEHGTGYRETLWLGTPALKCPFDLWIYQEIITETRPDLIVETGTAFGGSALFLASVCDLAGRGRVVSVDIHASDERPSHERITYLTGSSTDEDIVVAVREMAGGSERVMVLLDSNHAARYVQEELDAYAPLVTPGCYLVVEDTNVNGHPVLPDYGPGPMEALREFLPGHPEFEVDSSREKLQLTMNPNGFLRRAP